MSYKPYIRKFTTYNFQIATDITQYLRFESCHQDQPKTTYIPVAHRSAQRTPTANHTAEDWKNWK